MIEDGSEVLYRAATGLEKALVDVEARRFSGVPARLIVENWDPFKVRQSNLQYLAWSHGVTLWESTWTEDWKRQWLAIQGEFKARVGSLPAIRMALTPSGFEIKDLVRPPAGFFASPDLTADEMDAWIRLMPQIRIKFASKVGEASDEEWFEGDGFADDAWVGLDDGRILYGRVAVLRNADGTETPLDIVTETTRDETGQRISFERYALADKDALGFYSDEDSEGGDEFVVPDTGRQFIYSARLEASNDRQITTLSLTALNPGLTPLSPRYERDSDIGVGDEDMFAQDAICGIDFVVPEEAAMMLADRVYLLDPSVSGPMNAGVSFAGVDRVGMPVKTAEILVDLHGHDFAPAFFEEDNIVGESFATPHDSSDINRALRAINAGKALSQTVLASFEPYRPVSLGSNVTESTKLGDWLPAYL